MGDIDAAIRRLPGEQREVLLLVALEQLSYGETAQALGIPPGTVMSDSKGQRLTLYVRVNAEPARDSAFRFAQEKKSVCSTG